MKILRNCFLFSLLALVVGLPAFGEKPPVLRYKISHSMLEKFKELEIIVQPMHRNTGLSRADIVAAVKRRFEWKLRGVEVTEDDHLPDFLNIRVMVGSWPDADGHSPFFVEVMPMKRSNLGPIVQGNYAELGILNVVKQEMLRAFPLGEIDIASLPPPTPPPPNARGTKPKISKPFIPPPEVDTTPTLEKMSPTKRRKFMIWLLKREVLADEVGLNTEIREALNKSLDRLLLDYLESNVE